MPLNSFVAIDVETANYEPSSICAIGAVKVVDGVIVDSRYSLVRPEPDYYCRPNIRVHGITDDDTWNAPVFGSIWQELLPWIDGLPLVAHNAPFDSRCIAAACRIYRFDAPEQWHCTVKAARQRIPRAACPSKSLDSLCNFFGIPLKNHHNALDDAQACAKIAMIVLQ